MELRRFDAYTLVSHLPGGVPEQTPAFEAKTPWTGPWHIVAIGSEPSKLTQSEILRELRP
jgi:hypothetical protein